MVFKKIMMSTALVACVGNLCLAMNNSASSSNSSSSNQRPSTPTNQIMQSGTSKTPDAPKAKKIQRRLTAAQQHQVGQYRTIPGGPKIARRLF
jgi:hypothetical protein